MRARRAAGPLAAALAVLGAVVGAVAGCGVRPSVVITGRPGPSGAVVRESPGVATWPSGPPLVTPATPRPHGPRAAPR